MEGASQVLSNFDYIAFDGGYERGQNQDETHLTNVMNYIKLLIESHRHSQLFLISHFAVGFGAFNQADVCVLNGSNITVPMKHNEHVEIEG